MQTPIILNPLLRVTAAHPELDRHEPTSHWWMHSTNADGINQKMTEGYRLFRLKANDDGLFSALFVRNEGLYQLTGTDWAIDLTQQQVAEKMKDLGIRIISIAPRMVGAVPHYSIVYVSNKGSQLHDYTVVFEALNMNDLLLKAQAYGGRIVDFASVLYSTPSTAGGGGRPANRRFVGVVTKDNLPFTSTQWVGSTSLRELSKLIAQKRWQEKKPVRLLALENADGHEWMNYVLEPTGNDPYHWFYDGVSVTTLDNPDDLMHICRRLGARPVELRKNSIAGTYVACLVRNGALPVSGVGNAAFSAVDDLLLKTLATYGIAGASLGIMRKGQLVHAKGYGYADLAAATPVQPQTALRIASVSKPITALAVLRLIQDKTKLPNSTKLFGLDTKVFGELFAASTGTAAQKKLNQITVRHLLEHSAGLSDALGWISSPDQALDPKLEKPLEYDPGTSQKYRNGDYHLLGLIIGLVSGVSYGDYVKKTFVKPLQLPRTGFTEAMPAGVAESSYYDSSGSFNRIGDWSDTNARRSGGDAGLWVTDSPVRRPASAWATTPADLLRLLAAADGSRPGLRILDDAHFKLIATGSTWSGKLNTSPPTGFYGLGFNVSPVSATQYGLDHNGYLPGSTNALLRKRPDGLAYCWILNGDSAALFETAANEATPGLQHPLLIPEQSSVMWHLDGKLNEALNSIAPTATGGEDLFPQFGF